MRMKGYAPTHASFTGWPPPDNSGQAVHSAVPIGIGSARISLVRRGGE